MSLLPTRFKIFKHVVFNVIFELMIEKSFLSSTQSDFQPNDYCNNQLNAITHSIFSAFNANSSLEVPGVFLDLSKAFDKFDLKVSYLN